MLIKPKMPKGAMAWPEREVGLDIEDVILNYQRGLMGAFPDPQAREALEAELEEPDGEQVAYRYNFADGRQQGLVMLWMPAQLHWNVWPKPAQTTGDCRKAGSPVLMADGSQKAIEQVRIGERVISGLNKVRKVVDVIKKPYRRQLIRVHVKGYPWPIDATPDHLMLTYPKINEASGREETAWKPIGELQPGDHLLLPRGVDEDYTQVHRLDLADYYDGEIAREVVSVPVADGYIRAKNSKSPVPRCVDLDERLAWLLGLYLAEGSMDWQNDKPLRITLNLGSHRIVHAEQAKEYITQIFGVDARVYQVPSKPTVVYVQIHNNIVASLFAKLCPGNTYNKRFSPLLMTSTRSVRLAFLRGWLDGNGHINQKNRLSGVTASDELARGMFHVANSCGLRVSCSFRPAYKQSREARELRFGVCTSSHVYPEFKRRLKIDKNHKILTELGQAVEVVRVEEIPFQEEYVYCIGVEEDHSFISDGYAIHNCVGRAGSNIGIITIGIDASQGKPDEITGLVETFPEISATGIKSGVVAWENIYGDRGHRGQGASCDTLIRHVVKTGGIILRKDYPGVVNLEQHTNLGIQWGGSGTPEEVRAIGREHQIRTATQCRNWENAKDFIFRGYPLWICSGLGFSSQRDEYGFSKASGSWSHSWVVDGWDSRPEIVRHFGFELAHYNHDWGCYSADTEVLTEDGWKLFSELDYEDRIATLNPSIHRLEYQQPTKIFEYDFRGYLWKYQSRGSGVDLLVTDNHNLYVCPISKDRQCPESWELVQAKHAPIHVHLKKDAIWEGEEIAVKEVGPYRIPMDDWLEFLGVFIAEGHTLFRRRIRNYVRTDGSVGTTPQIDYTIGINQIKPEGVKKIEAILAKMPFSMNRTKNGWSKNIKCLYEELSPLGKQPDRRLPDYVKGLSPRQLEHLFYGLMLGDGSLVQTETGPRETYFTSSSQLADDIQEIALKMGLAANIAVTDRRGRINKQGITRHLEYRVGIRRKSMTPRCRNGLRPLLVPYSGKIYCAEVPNHLMYVRRNGKAVWCGNSWNRGPRTVFGANVEIPEGSFWFDARLLDRCDITAMSSIHGWAQRTLPPMVTGIF